MSIHKKFDENGHIIELMATNEDAVRAEAAPKLLEACKIALLALTHKPINPDDIAYIKSAIAKAESEK